MKLFITAFIFPLSLKINFNGGNFMKRWFFKALFLLTGNKPAQFILEKLFYITRMLMGQGSGSFPSSSGA